MSIACALIFDVNCFNKVEMKLFDMCATLGEDASTTETLLSAKDNVMKKRSVVWNNCINIGVCNTN